ncbi:DUF2232 domain-containing protein [Mariprofundus sp. EBB-1]|uniref:DUF2232 domain-containing protein n=1 Tax=Mariprofundus sp. EBB-1 TaxID=2650971 RepID=UPI000EF24F2A|nr:DUF2232 domain-containing protein [Mariprofundus sp. EBB-1]RLL53674.1 DUF2232 domain-containing protein [Mariprofundus sp. EBB-1]
MIQQQSPAPQPMPKMVAFVLTHRLPCAVLMLVMLMSVVWLPLFSQGLAPFLLLVATMIGLTIHMFVPAVVALVTFGGGLIFASHVSAITAIAVMLITGFAFVPGLIVFVAYGLLPMVGALFMMRPNGVKQSAEWLALGLGCMSFIALAIAAMMHDVGMKEWVNQLLAPMFEGVEQQITANGQIVAGDHEAAQMLEQGREMMVAILPGLMAFGIWLTWWSNLVFARHFASKYGFYQGDTATLLTLRFGKPIAYVFLVLLLLMNFTGAGDLQYIASNAAILTGGMLAMQGVAVGHSWLKAKGMMLSIAMMYLMLLIWSVMIIPFVIIGLLDIWFDYRRKIPVVGG